MQILITGGTGLIGRALCQALLANQHKLTVLSRKPDKVARLCGDQVKAISSLEQWDADTEFDAVINLAGEPIIGGLWTSPQKNRLWTSRVDLTENLVERITKTRCKPKVLLSGSAIGYYGNSPNEIFEETHAGADDFAASLCKAWEKAAEVAINQQVRVCLLRTGIVMDSSDGMLAKMLLSFRLGLGARLGDGKQWLSWIHLDDYVAIVLKLLEDTNAEGAYNLTAPNPVTNAEFTKTLATVLKRPRFLVAPSFILKLVLGEMAQLLIGGQRVLPKRVQLLPYNFRYPELNEALREILGRDG
jgi:uncharacterized protein (TIGR01777 family)